MKKALLMMIGLVLVPNIAVAHQDFGTIKCDNCPSDKPFQQSMNRKCSKDLTRCFGCDTPWG